MIDLHLPNFITIALISVLAWLGFEWALTFMGMKGAN